MKKVAIVCCAVILLSFLPECSADQQNEPDGKSPDILVGACQNLNIVMAHNSNTGIQIIHTSTMNTVGNNSMIDLPNHYLPPECDGGNNHHCGILHFEYSGHSYYIIPLIRSFIMLSHSIDNTDLTEETQRLLVNISERCNPTRAFHTKGNHIIIVCMDLQTQPRGILYYLNYNFIPNGTGSGSIAMNTDLPTTSEPIYNPETVSEIIHVRGQVRCPEKDNLYIIDDDYVLQYPPDAFDPDITPSNHPLEDCTGYQSFEYHGNDSLIIRCSNNRTALYDTCSGRFTYQSHDRIPYPCTNWSSTIAYRNGSKLRLINSNGEYTTQKLPFSDLRYGRCIHRVDHPIFIASSADGSIFIAPFDGHSNFTEIISGNCSNNNMPCPRPVFSENEQIFGTLDSTSHTFVIVNMTERCTDDPIIAHIPTPFIPSLISVSLGKGTYNCNCPLPIVHSDTSITTSTSEATYTSTGMLVEYTAKQTESSTATNPLTVSTKVPVTSMIQTISSTSISQIADVNALVSIPLAVIAFIIVVTVILIIIACRKHLYYYFCHKGNDINVQSEQESSLAIASQHTEWSRPSVLTLNQCLPGRFESGRTSWSGSDEEMISISGESRQTTSCYAEAGLVGGACITSSVLPIHPTTETLRMLYESRTLDNDKKADMDNKFELFRTFS